MKSVGIRAGKARLPELARAAAKGEAIVLGTVRREAPEELGASPVQERNTVKGPGPTEGLQPWTRRSRNSRSEATWQSSG